MCFDLTKEIIQEEENLYSVRNKAINLMVELIISIKP